MSLVSDTINTMGDQSVQSGEPDDGISSIPLAQSFKDWWQTPSSLMKPSTTNKSFVEARAKNLTVEYELFRAILSDDIKINIPGQPLKYHKDLSDIYVGSFIDTELDDGNYIHEFYLENRFGPPSDTIVIIHGYMASCGYFVKNFEDLVKSKPGVRIHVIDLPGFGNSSRPKFPGELLKAYPPDKKVESINQVLEVENWFIDKIESWRVKNSLHNFKLIGHSMGGYLGCCYLMKYNFQQVKDFIIVSPMGTESNYVSLINEKSLQGNFHDEGSNPLHELAQRQEEDGEILEDGELVKLWETLGRPKFPQNVILKKLWEWNISPFQLLQLFGPFFSKILSVWSYQRFKNLRDNSGNKNHDLLLKLHYYSYSIFNQFQGSGELAITKLINHEILPRLPLCDRGLVEFFTKNKIRTLWMYGEKDWMNSKGGEYIYNQLKEEGAETEFSLVKNAGHHLYLDNPKEFNRVAIEFLL